MNDKSKPASSKGRQDFLDAKVTNEPVRLADSSHSWNDPHHTQVADRFPSKDGSTDHAAFLTKGA